MTYHSPFAAVDIPELPLPDFVFEHFEQHLDRTALIDGETGATLTYHELVSRVRHLAAGLVSRGVRRADVCAIYAPNVPDYVVVFYAILTAGGIVTTVNPLYTATELTHQLRDSGAKFLITTSKLARKARQAAQVANIVEIFTIGHAMNATPLTQLLDTTQVLEPIDIDPKSDIAVLPYSSGTTGLAKGVMLTHYGIVANLQQIAAVEQIEGHEVLLATLPFYHIYGMVMVMNQGLRAGATIVTLSRFRAKRLFKIIEQYRITTAYLVPPLIRTFATHKQAGASDLSSLRDVISSAAPLPEGIARACAERLRCQVRQAYGLTETSPLTHITPRNGPRMNAVGFPIPNTEFRVVGVAVRRDVAPGMLGEVWVRGPQLMKGYLNNPEATRAMIDGEGWLHTGDIGFADKDGCLHVVDRAKELVKFRGLHYGERELLRSMVEDIAARRQVSERLQFQALLLNSVRESVVATDARHRVTFWNRGAEALFGYEAADAIGHIIDALIIPLGSDIAMQWHAEIGEVTKHGKWQGHALRCREDGSQLWTDVVMSVVRNSDGLPSGYIAIHRDITDLRRNQEMLHESREQLRTLASSLMLVREDERSTISRELHDELGQALTRIKMDLRWLTDRLPAQARGPREDSMMRLVDSMVEKVQHICGRLRPAILDDMGLEAAIEAHVQDFASWNGCRYKLELRMPDLRPQPDRDTAVFRIVQEALTNVARHGHATLVRVRGDIVEGAIVIDVEDNGVGTSEDRMASPLALGLIGMRERAENVGGSLTIRRRPRQGTIVRLRVPIDGSRHVEAVEERERVGRA